MSYRFFGNIVAGKIVLENDDIFHLTKVLRIKEHETIEIVADGHLYLCEIETFSPLAFRILSSTLLNEEKPSVTLYYALPKGDKLDLVIQKSVELGVSRIVLINTTNAVVKFEQDKVKNKLKRFEGIVKSAAMQSKRNAIPEILGPIDFKKIINEQHEIKLFAHEKATHSLAKHMLELNTLPSNIALFVGPEGGFSDEEVSLAKNANAHIISYGSHILRSETAVFYGLSVINNYIEGLK